MNEIAKNKAAIEDAETQNKVSNPGTCIMPLSRVKTGCIKAKDQFLHSAIRIPGFFFFSEDFSFI